MHFCDRSTILTCFAYSTLRLRARNIKIILQKKNLSFSHLPLPSKYQEEERRYLEEEKRWVPPIVTWWIAVASSREVRRSSPLSSLLLTVAKILYLILCNRITCISHLGIHRRLSHEDFEPGRTFASLSFGHSKFGHLQRESCAIGHSYTIFFAISVRTLWSRDRRNRIMTPNGVSSLKDCLFQRGARRFLLRGERWRCGCPEQSAATNLHELTDAMDTWARRPAHKRRIWKPGCSRGSRSLWKMCYRRPRASVPLHSSISIVNW